MRQTSVTRAKTDAALQTGGVGSVRQSKVSLVRTGPAPDWPVPASREQAGRNPPYLNWRGIDEELKTTMERTLIRALNARTNPLDEVLVKGWVKTRRDSKTVSFLELNDGSCRSGIQVVCDHTGDKAPGPLAEDLRTGAAVAVSGALVESLGSGQRFEIQAREIILIGGAPESYPLQKKRHTDEYLRTIAHLRARTKKYGALLRIRSRLSARIHTFFQDRGFHYIHTPIITGSDCEGAGEMFHVTTLNPTDPRPPGTPAEIIDQDFFGKPAHLTVSGQLAVETCCMGLGDVYTFGPTFRSENSNTSRHAAEFWMIEPEMAFADLEQDMAVAEAMVRDMAEFVVSDTAEDIGLFTQFVDKDLEARLKVLIEGEYVRLPYTDAISILEASGRDFEFKPAWGEDLQSEHERFLTEVHFKSPVFVTDWPADIKAFYMRMNDDGRTVAAMDLLVPGVGELIGGSQREERLDVLESRIVKLGFDPADYWWYLDLRRFGSAPHAGFGLGFERALMLLTGIGNIRDVIPFPRTPRNLEF